MTAPGAVANAASARANGATVWFAAAAVVAFGSVGIALVSQHAFGMEPCPWCVLQRLIFLAIGVLAVAGLALRRARVGAIAVAALVLALAVGGVAAAIRQSQAEKSGSCNLTLADRIVGAAGLDNAWPDVFMARASCADAAVDLLGLRYWVWSTAAFVLSGGFMAGVLRNARG